MSHSKKPHSSSGKTDQRLVTVKKGPFEEGMTPKALKGTLLALGVGTAAMAAYISNGDNNSFHHRNVAAVEQANQAYKGIIVLREGTVLRKGPFTQDGDGTNDNKVFTVGPGKEMILMDPRISEDNEWANILEPGVDPKTIKSSEDWTNNSVWVHLSVLNNEPGYEPAYFSAEAQPGNPGAPVIHARLNEKGVYELSQQDPNAGRSFEVAAGTAQAEYAAVAAPQP